MSRTKNNLIFAVYFLSPSIKKDFSEYPLLMFDKIMERRLTKSAIGPLLDPVTWYGINYAGRK